jgi:hypothetical protein
MVATNRPFYLNNHFFDLTTVDLSFQTSNVWFLEWHVGLVLHILAVSTNDTYTFHVSESAGDDFFGVFTVV